METMINSPFSNSTKDEDYISNLPDVLIHHILSFVKVKQAVQTCILSTRWRNIWTSLPFLDFDGSDLSHGCYDFVENVLSFRDNRCFDIKRFHLLGVYGTHGCNFINCLRRWTVFVARYNVEDLNVQFNGDISDDEEEFEVPTCVSTSKSLTKLELDLDRHQIILLNSISLPRLKYLKLTNTSFNHGLLTKLCSSCPVLEHLDLRGVEITEPSKLTISSLTLKHLELHINDYGSSHTTLRLYAPNLVYLVLSNLDDMLLENVSSLVTADVGLSRRQRKPHPESIHAPDTLDSLKQLHNVKDLTISFQAVKDVRRVQEVLENQPFQFSNLQRLKLQTMSPSTDAMHFIASLLKISPIIKSLELELGQEDSDDEGSNSGSESGSETTLDLDGLLVNSMKQLKLVTVTGLQGSDIELKLIEILFKNCIVLKKMVLKMDSRNDITEFCEKVDSFSSASSSFKMYLIATRKGKATRTDYGLGWE